MKGTRRQDKRYNKSDDFIAGITNVYVNVRSGCMWSSARMSYVDSKYGRSWVCAAGRSTRVAVVGRVAEIQLDV